MQIKITNISDGHHFYNFEVKASEFDLSLDYTTPIFLDVDLEKSSDNIILNCKLHFNKLFDCDRCLIKFDKYLDSNFTIVYIHDEKNIRIDDDNFILIPKEQDIIDIKNIVKEYVLLADPMKLLCKDDCKGICPRCGKDRNIEKCNCQDDDIDPRWEKLRRINQK